MLSLLVSLAFAADPAALEVHEWSFHVVDPTVKQANDKDHFSNALPGLANSLRHESGLAAKSPIAPLAVLMFHGQPVKNVDITLRSTSGRFLAHWPRGEEKSRRVQWRGLDLQADFDAERRAYIHPDHWAARARQLAALEIKHGARQERFLAYDAELTLPVPLALSGGPDRFTVRNTGSVPLYDVAIFLPAKEGLRVAWLDRLDVSSDKEKPASKSESNLSDGAGKSEAGGVEIALASPLSEAREEYAAQTTGELRKRLIAAGLAEPEAELLLSVCGKSIFQSKEMVALFRLPPDAMDERFPLEVLPEPRKTVRVALVLATNINPGVKDEIATLVTQLGDPKYSLREAAEKRLMELGPLAQAALKEALKQSDLEIVHRAERLLRRQNALQEQ